LVGRYITGGTCKDNTVKKSEHMESSAFWASDKGSCSEAVVGATGQEPVESGTGGSPLIEENNLSCSQTSENLEGLTKKSVLSVTDFQRRIAVVPPESRRGKPGWRRLPLGPLTVVNLSPLLAINRRVCKGLVHLQLKEWDQPQWNRNPQRVGGIPRFHKNDSGWPRALRVAGKLRCCNRLGNLVMPGPLRRASEWLL
jgi:hypothetical protein